MTENEALEEHKKDCKRCRDKACTHGWDCLQKKDIEVYEELERYRAIGTVEGYERAIQSSVENYNLYRECKAKLQEYEAIGTIEELQDLKSRLRSYKDQMSIYAEQHKVILASDVLEALEELEW